MRFDPDWVMEQVAEAPATFPIQARNPERSVVIGEGPPICMNVGGPPFASDLDEGRRSGRLQDHDALVKMTQATDLLAFVQSGAVEPQDLDVVTPAHGLRLLGAALVRQAVHVLRDERPQGA